MLSILFVQDEAQPASPTPLPRGRGTVLALARGTAMTVLYQCREREKKILRGTRTDSVESGAAVEPASPLVSGVLRMPTKAAVTG